MMKIEIRKVLRPLRLAEYAAEYGETALAVWVNPPKALGDERVALARMTYEAKLAIAESEAESEAQAAGVAQLREAGEKTLAWLAKIWSQEEPWSVEEITQLYESDPALYQWLLRRTFEMVDEHRSAEKKS
jgi:hypothetical protein